jgi:hypothetical protein
MMSKPTAKQLMDRIEWSYPRDGVHTFNRCSCDKHIMRGYGPCAYCLTDQLGELIGADNAEFFHRRVRKLSDLYHSILNGVKDDD